MSISNVARYCLLTSCFFGVLTAIASVAKVPEAQFVFSIATLTFISLFFYEMKRQKRLRDLQRTKERWLKRSEKRRRRAPESPPTCAAAQPQRYAKFFKGKGRGEHWRRTMMKSKNAEEEEPL